MSSVNLVKKFAAMLVVGFPNCAPPSSVQSAKRWNALGVLKDRCQNVLGVVPKTLALIVVLIRSAAHAMKCMFVNVKVAKKEGIFLRVQHAMKLFVQQTIQVNATIVGYVFVSTALLMRRVMGQYITHMETLVPGTNGNVVEPIYVRGCVCGSC